MAIKSEKDRLMETVNIRAGYYRANPHRFAKDFLGINLKIFQMILLYMMNISAHFCYLASRGQGKSFLCSIFCVIRCILYPGTKICIASSTRGQAQEIIDKIIEDLMPNSPLLRNEIKSKSTSYTDYSITFKNGSIIKVVTAGDSSRHNRANILVIDEFRMVPKHIVDTVLRKFLTAPRHPRYLDKPEYKHLKERNKEIYLSSAYFKKHWSWEKVQSFCTGLVDDKKEYFICGLPYQLAMKEDLLDWESVAEEMTEDDFNEISWSMEMGCLWFGESEDAFFSYESLTEARVVQNPFYPSWIVDRISNNNLKTPIKKDGEVRLVIADIAVMASKKHKNDATSIHILQLLPTKSGQYIRNLVYSTSMEGGHSELQALTIRRLYEDFQCDYIVIDANGVGNGVFDFLVKDLIDPDTGEIYPALSCKNDEAMADKYQGSSKAPVKAIYSIKATAEFNSICATQLKDNINRKKTRLLISEREADTVLKNYKGFKNLSQDLKAELLLPYIQTTLLINEIVNLEYDVTGNKVKIYEKGTNRKDRYSALAYGNYVATELEREITKKKKAQKKEKANFNFRKPKIKS